MTKDSAFRVAAIAWFVAWWVCVLTVNITVLPWFLELLAWLFLIVTMPSGIVEVFPSLRWWDRKKRRSNEDTTRAGTGAEDMV